MGAEALIHKLATLDVELAADGNRLRFRPVERVTPDLLAQLREHKADLLAALASGAAGDGFDGGDMKKAERGHALGQVAVMAAVGDDQPPFDKNRVLGVGHVVPLSAGRDDAERLEGLLPQEALKQVDGHAGIVSPLSASYQAAPVDAGACQAMPTDPAVRAAGRRKLAELGWVTGDRLAALPEELQGLVMPREGWTPGSWAEHTRYLAGRCAALHPDRADLYRRASALLVAEARRIGRGGPA